MSRVAAILLGALIPCFVMQGTGFAYPFGELMNNDALNGQKFDSPQELKQAEGDAALFIRQPLRPKDAAICWKDGMFSPVSPICLSDLDAPVPVAQVHHWQSKRVKKLALQMAAEQFLKGHPEKIDLQVSAGSLSSALKKRAHASRLQAMLEQSFEKLMQPQVCFSQSVYLASATFFEEKLQEGSLQKAVQLYEKSLRCADAFSSHQAAYRLGLLAFLKKDYQRALSFLTPLIRMNDEDKEMDVRMRAAFWGLMCHSKLGHQDQFNLLREKFLRDYPLSFHALTLQELSGKHPFHEEEPIEVLTRSVLSPQLSRTTRLVELLLKNKEKTLAAQLLSDQMDHLVGLEPAFQLYWVVLLKRAQSTLSGFEILRAVFREHPNWMTPSTLKLMYPVPFLQKIQGLHLSEDPFFLLSIMRQESAFNPNARSPTGALGLMQVQPQTARQIKKRVTKAQLVQPEVNIQIGSLYVKKLLERFPGEPELAIGAYNAGPSRMEQWLRNYPIDQKLLFIDFLPVVETRDYITSVMKNFFWYHALYHTEIPSDLASTQSQALADKPGERNPAASQPESSEQFFLLFKRIFKDF